LLDFTSTREINTKFILGRILTMINEACTEDVESYSTKDDPDKSKGVKDKYKVANYKEEHLQGGGKLDIFHRTSVKGRRLITTAFGVKTFQSAIIGVTWRPLLFFLVLYYAFQVFFRVTDQQFLSNQDLTDWIKKMKKHDSTASKYLTFILGFYVGQMITRWWDQVKSLPYIDPITNSLSGFIQIEFKDDLKSKESALDLKKKIARYCLLSWTMCLAHVSHPLQLKFKTADKYIEKGLITERELRALQGTRPSSWSRQWWIPLNWAASLINSNHPESQGCKVKESKELIKELNKFLSKLHHVERYQTNPLPLIYGQAVMVAIYSWIFLGVFASQYVKDLEKDLDLLGIIRTIPLFQIVKILLIYSWLKVAHIVRNPFGSDYNYDINLEQFLDQNIWKASSSIMHLDNPIYLK